MGSYETNITVTRVHSILSTVLPLLPCRSQRWTQRDLWYIWPLRPEREQRNPWCAELVSGWQWIRRIPSQCPGNGQSRIAHSDLWPSWHSRAWWGDQPKHVHQICWGGQINEFLWSEVHYFEGEGGVRWQSIEKCTRYVRDKWCLYHYSCYWDFPSNVAEDTFRWWTLH